MERPRRFRMRFRLQSILVLMLGIAIGFALKSNERSLQSWLWPSDPPPIGPPAPYVIEPPDILLINAVKMVPRGPYNIGPFDGLLLGVTGLLDNVQPISDVYSVDPEGNVDLGPSYGKVKVVGLTVDEAKEAVRKQLAYEHSDVSVSLSLAFSAGAQPIVGEHLVGPDGRVNLGTYGSVYVAGLTLKEARAAIENALVRQIDQPEVVVDVLAYNSKRYYVVTQGFSKGDNVVECPITGNETVLDAFARIGGISKLTSSKIWIARATNSRTGVEQILPVNGDDIASGASNSTNYQLLPGDRLFVKRKRWW